MSFFGLNSVNFASLTKTFSPNSKTMHQGSIGFDGNIQLSNEAPIAAFCCAQTLVSLASLVTASATWCLRGHYIRLVDVQPTSQWKIALGNFKRHCRLQSSKP